MVGLGLRVCDGLCSFCLGLGMLVFEWFAFACMEVCSNCEGLCVLWFGCLFVLWVCVGALYLLGACFVFSVGLGCLLVWAACTLVCLCLCISLGCWLVHY